MLGSVEEHDPYLLYTARRSHAHATEQLARRIALSIAVEVRQAFRWARSIDVALLPAENAALALGLADVRSASQFRLRDAAPDALRALAAQIDPDLDWLYRLAWAADADCPPHRTLDLHQPATWYTGSGPDFDWQSLLARYPFQART